VRGQNAVRGGDDEMIFVPGPLQADGAGLVLLIDLGVLGGARLGSSDHPQLNAIGLILSQKVGSSVKIETLEKREGRPQAGGGPGQDVLHHVGARQGTVGHPRFMSVRLAMAGKEQLAVGKGDGGILEHKSSGKSTEQFDGPVAYDLQGIVEYIRGEEVDVVAAGNDTAIDGSVPCNCANMGQLLHTARKIVQGKELSRSRPIISEEQQAVVMDTEAVRISVVQERGRHLTGIKIPDERRRLC